ncbi:MAG: LPS-assembly protein LptD [Alphaproteobacteria bacterium]|nr:LPS-assembly protein LptD [Alphaproteobacteria bacterium]
MSVFRAIIVLLFLCNTAHAVEPDTEPSQYLLSASEIQNDNEKQIVTATGAVEIHNDQKILKADAVEFQQKTNVVSASGNVALITEDSNVVFAKEAVLSSDFSNGRADSVAMLMADNSRFAANDARRLDNRYMRR